MLASEQGCEQHHVRDLIRMKTSFFEVSANNLLNAYQLFRYITWLVSGLKVTTPKILHDTSSVSVCIVSFLQFSSRRSTCSSRHYVGTFYFPYRLMADCVRNDFNSNLCANVWISIDRCHQRFLSFICLHCHRRRYIASTRSLTCHGTGTRAARWQFCTTTLYSAEDCLNATVDKLSWQLA